MDDLPAFPLDHLCLRGRPDAPALLLADGVIDYQGLNVRIGRLAEILSKHCGEAGARVATWTGKDLVACLIPLAAARAGLVHVPLNPQLKRAQVAHIVGNSGALLLIGNTGRLASLGEGDLPSYCSMIAAEDVAAEIEADGPEAPPSQAQPDDLAAILYTSGSTGLPKGVMLSHRNLVLGALAVSDYLHLRPDDVTLAVLPLSFDYGQNQLLSSWAAGAAVAPVDYLMPRDVMRAVERFGVTTLAAVPPLWLQLLDNDWPVATAARLRRLTNSGGALTAPLVKGLRSTFPAADLYPMYGLTEAFRSTYLDPALVDSHPTAMGRAIPFAEILVVRPDGTPTDDGEAGELVHCGPLVAQGYWRDTERTAARFRPAPHHSRYGGKAVWSGDTVRRDGDGLLYFVGRDDEMIKTSGNRVSPTEIEEAAVSGGLVTEACAFGVVDKRLGQAIVLIVKGDDAVAKPLAIQLRALLPGFMQPQRIMTLPRLPRSANGKYDRAALAMQAAK